MRAGPPTRLRGLAIRRSPHRDRCVLRRVSGAMDIGSGSGAEVAAGRVAALVGLLAVLGLAVAPLGRRPPGGGARLDRARGGEGPIELRSARGLRAVPGVGRVRARALVEARWALGQPVEAAWWLGVPGVGPVTAAALARVASSGEGASAGCDPRGSCCEGADILRSGGVEDAARLDPWFESLLGSSRIGPLTDRPPPGPGGGAARGARLRASDGPPALASRP